MRTVVFSDLHVGARSGADLTRLPEIRERFAEAARGADRVVLLGDVLELRERTVEDAAARATPLLEALGGAIGGSGEVLIVPGNHDHELVRRGAGRVSGLEHRFGAAAAGVAPLERALGGATLSLAYPGAWLGDGVYATHGHYLDLHSPVPTFENLAIAAAARLTGGGRDYERAAWAMYPRAERLGRALAGRGGGANVSAGLWDAVREDRRDGRRGLAERMLAVLVPASVGAANLAGLGPFAADFSGVTLRRSALAAMGEVVRTVGVEAETVVFGHTHRPGPLPGDERVEWELPGGGRLVNAGSWVHEPVFLRGGEESPYWPGTCVVLEDAGEPRVRRLLEDVDLARVAA